MKNFSELVLDSKSDKCLVTLKLDLKEKRSYYESIGKCTIPSMEAYAKKYKVNFEIINKNLIPGNIDDNSWQSNVFTKLHVFDLLEKYKKIFFIELDCYISEKCDSVFEKYKDAYFACGYFNADKSNKDVLKLAKKLNLPDPKLGISAGVLIIDRSIKDIFKFPNFDLLKNDFFGAAEENWLSLIVSENQHILTQLDYSYLNGDPNSNWNVFHAYDFKHEKKYEILNKIFNKNKKISLL